MSEMESLAKLDSMLDDSPQEGVPYVKAHPIENKLSKEKKDEVHQIVQEILKFGVNQRQLLYLIQQLSMNLEDREVMLALIETISQNRERIPTQAPKIVTETGLPATGKKRLVHN